MKWKPMSLGGVLLILAGALAQCLPTYKLRSDKEVERRRPGRLFSAHMDGWMDGWMMDDFGGGVVCVWMSEKCSSE